MNRKTFFKKLAIGAAAVAVTPKIIAKIKPDSGPTGIVMIPPDLSSSEMQDFVDEWRRYNGVVVYKSDMDESNRRLIEIFEEEPDLIEIFRDINNGSTFREALSKHFVE